jgi:hypothetical protein
LSSDGLRYCAPVAMMTARAVTGGPPSIRTPNGWRSQASPVAALAIMIWAPNFCAWA